MDLIRTSTKEYGLEGPVEMDRLRWIIVNKRSMSLFLKMGSEAADPDLFYKSAVGVRAFFFACLYEEDKTVTLEDVGGWIHPGNMARLTVLYTEALTKVASQVMVGRHG